MGATLRIYDPMMRGEVVFGLRSARSLKEALTGADCIVIVTAHDEFRTLTPKSIAQASGGRVAIVDSRNVIDPKAAQRAGFVYRGVGRGMDQA
jgi:UDP-N-acetyl-D-mannosaminuronate dehydrogenase